MKFPNLSKSSAEKSVAANSKQTARGVQPHLEQAVGVELSRNALSRERFEFLMKLIMYLAIVQVISVVGMIYLASRPVKTIFVATTSDGKISNIDVLSQPLQSQQAILSWTSSAVMKAYTMSFANYAQQLNDIKPTFTTNGWTSYQQALQRSGFIEQLVGSKFITTAVPSAAPTIVTEGMVDGAWGWRLQVPMIITFRSAGVDTTTPINAQVTVVQRPSDENPAGLGIAQIISQ